MSARHDSEAAGLAGSGGPGSVAPPGREAVEAAIPHRDPFLLVDRVLEEGEGHLAAEWRVPADAAWFRGHYPGQPVLPGVLACEHVFQTAAVLVSRRLGGFDPADGIPVLTKVEGARFKRLVRPGELLSTRVELREELSGAYFLSGQSAVEGETVLRVRFVLAATGSLAGGGS